MGRNQDQELQQSFLEEAQTYLDTIETSVLGLAGRGIEQDSLDGALRAAHSIKGGAAMMGLKLLSQIAHRLEDFFKILIARRDSIELDSELETQLLQAGDRLSQVCQLYRQGELPTQAWWNAEARPVFQQLQLRLGELQPEDENALLSRDEGTNVAVKLFETEVEPLLLRLEAQIGQLPAAELCAECLLMAEDLAALGRMLKLDAFVQLCEHTIQHLQGQKTQQQTAQVEAIAQAAIKTWRRSQAMIVVGQTDRLPKTLDGIDVQIPVPQTSSSLGSVMATDANFTDLSEIAALLSAEAEALAVHSPTPVEAPVETPSLESIADATLGEVMPALGSGDMDLCSLATLLTEAAALEPETTPPPASALPKSTFSEQTLDPSKSRQTEETTVRIPLKLLQQLNDLFGNLLITRNALDLRLGRMQSSVELLRDRVHHIEASNYELRTFHDRITTQAVAARPHALLAARASTHASKEVQFDQLEKDQYSDLHLLSQDQMENVVQLQEVATDIELDLTDTRQAARQLNQTIKQLQLKVTQTRMRPLSDLMGRFPRMVRDLSVEYGKPVELKIQGGSTLIDRAVLEALIDPLLHLLRNAFDHGIDPPQVRKALGKPAQGVIEIRASHRGNQTVIQVRDDGGGINLDKIRARAYDMGISPTHLEQVTEAELLDLIFEPGFSTASKVTDLSGRGVGMDIVRTNLRKVRGEIKVDTQLNQGSLFTLAVPFTLSALRVLLVESQNLVMAFPTDEVAEMVAAHPEILFESGGQTHLSWNEQTLPVFCLADYLVFRCPQRSPDAEESPKIDASSILILRQGEHWIGLRVDRFWAEQEVAVRAVEGILSMPQGFAGSTILGNGRVVPLVDTVQLLNAIVQDSTARLVTQPRPKTNPMFDGEKIQSQLSATPQPATPQRSTIMVVDDSINVRRFLAQNLERVGYHVIQAKDGQDAVEKLAKVGGVDAMVCDLEMPRLDGYGVLSEVRSSAQWRHLPVIMLTSRSGEKHRTLALQLGASAYFSKPYNEQSLFASLSALLQPTSSSEVSF